jgi:putative hydrolase of the HAD superfamily
VLDACLDPACFHFLTSPGIETRPEADSGVISRFKAVVFDVYGTLRLAPAGGVKPDPGADSLLRNILADFGCEVPDSPSTAIHAALRRHHAASPQIWPEVDLRILWREVAALPDGADVDALVIAIESAWHPSSWMPAAEQTVWRLHALGIPLGIISNAQCDTLPSLGDAAACFATDLTVLSYQHGMAKPSPTLFELLVERLARRGITPEEILYIGNDPRHDIAPAAACGFQTALFTGHPDSLRPGYHPADFILRRWPG